ncbi:MAG: branched-chain amino acid ABC transporter permease [Nitrososphaerota archaeon]
MYLLVYGVINGVILSLISLGFALVYSISRVPNFAHGAVYITTGYIVWIVLNKLHLPYVLAIVAGILAIGFIGALLYKLVLIRIRGLELSEIIATYAAGVAIIEGLRWGGLRGMTFTLPVFLDGSLNIYGVVVDYQRIIAVILGAVMFLCLYSFTHHTKVGLALRGIAQDERAAMMLGIDSDWTALLSLAIGSALAGFSAVILLPLGNIVVEAGYSILIFSIAVCIMGGLGSLLGTVIASFMLGFALVLTDKFLSTHYQMVVALLTIIITLVLKPSGLLGKQKELEERV